MKVTVDSWAWLPIAELTHMQVSAMKAALTVQPRKFEGFPGEPPALIRLYAEKDGYLGVPRSYFMEHRKPHHEIDDQTTLGRADLWGGGLRFTGSLRPTQVDAVQTVKREFKLKGQYGGILRAPPGFGKTVVSCAIMAELGVPTLVVVHKDFLVSQWKERIEQFLPGAKVGIVQQDRCEFRDYDVAIGMIHSLVGGRDYGEDFWGWPGLLITDECFPAGTLIATPNGTAKPIEAFNVGDAVLSAVGSDTVARTFCKEVPVEQLRLVQMEDGSEFICTSTHPVLSATSGWISAAESSGHLLLTAAGCVDTMRGHGYGATENPASVRDMRKTELCAEGQEVLLSRLYGQGQEADGAVSSVRVVWGSACEAEAIPFLREQLSREVASETDVVSIFRAIGAHEGVASTEPLHSEGRVPADASSQPHEARGGACKSVAHPETDAASSSYARGEWEGTNRASKAVAGSIGGRLDSRVCSFDAATPQQSSIATLPLQGGPSLSEPQSSSRSGWQESQDTCGTAARPKEVRVAAVVRVASVTLPKRADFKRLGWGSVGDTGRVAVYNLSVVRHPSYILHESKVLVHNCHRIGAETWSVVPTRFKARWRLGVSATPRRKDGAENVFFQHIGPVLFSAEEQRMTPKIRRVWTDFKLVQTATLNPQLVSKNVLLKFMCGNKARNTLITEQLVLAVAAGRKPIVLSERLNHLDMLADMFRREWQAKQTAPVPSVGFYVGGMKEEELEEAAKAQVVFATRQFAEEGLDIPALDTLFLTTPISDVEQACGRVLRPHEGKKDPVIVDFRDDKVPSCEKTAAYRDRFYQTRQWSNPVQRPA